MTTGQLIIVCITFLVAIAILAVTVAVIAEVLPPHKKDQGQGQGLDLISAGTEVVVHTRRPDDVSIRGKVASSHPDRVILRNATYLNSTGGQSAKGLVNIPTLAVSSWQEIEDEDEDA